MIQNVLCHLKRSGWLLLALAITACAQQTSKSELTPTSITVATEAPTESSAGDKVGDVVKITTEALATALGIDAADVTMISMERQDFRDAALSCAQPGEMAAAVITPGFKVVLSTGGAQYELHTNLNGTMVRCLPMGTSVADASTPLAPTPTPVPTPDDGIDKTTLDIVEAALESKDYARLKTVMPSEFWMGFYASEAGKETPEEALNKLEEIYLGPGLVRVYRDIDVSKLLPDWSSAAPYARLVYSTGWGEGQKDDAILLFEEQGEALNWAGLFYIFDGLKKTAYGDGTAQLPSSPVENLSALAEAIENKDYERLKPLLANPFRLGFYASEGTEFSPDTFIETLRDEYLEPGEVKVRFDVDVAQLSIDWTGASSCTELIYSTGWGQDQADDGILCLKDDGGVLRWSEMLYIFADLKAIIYPELPSEKPSAGDAEGMVYIPAGKFIMGSNETEIGAVRGSCTEASAGCDAGQFEDEAPQREITLDAFYIDETEVTVAQFKAFAGATGYQTTSEAKGDPVQYTWRAFDFPDRQDHPVRWMSWFDAQAYCQWAGKRLPTEAEWERAARGNDGRLYPWGDLWDEARVPHGDTALVKSLPDGAGPDGVLGMASGVWEWVADWYDPVYYQYGPTINPTGPEKTADKVLRGGAFDNAIFKHRAAHRHYGGAAGYAHDHGFRCAKDTNE